MSVTRDLIERELAKPWNRPRAVAFVRLHDADESHYRHAAQTMTIAVTLFMLLVLVEPFLLHGILIVSLVARLLVAPALLAALLWFFRARPPLAQVHLSMALTVVLGALLWSYITLAGADDGPNYYFFAGFLFLQTPNIFMRLKFRIAVLSSALMLLIISTDALLLPHVTWQMLVVDVILALINLILTLYANWSLDQKTYALFLHQLLGKLDQQELAQRNIELQALSSTDALTGIGNRRAAEAALDVLWRGRQEFALAIIDVDYFKLFNDHYGHVAGDGCLRMVAEAAQTTAQQLGAQIFRLGGEEFIMLLPCDTARAALGAAGAILVAVRDRDIPHPARPDALRRVTVSIGVAFDRDVAAAGVSDLLHAADRALYRAKALGRNQLVSFVPEMLAEKLVLGSHDRPRDMFSGIIPLSCTALPCAHE
jgi:diguanylate cyclase (GGDEF)-like protein